ncbi:MAG: hypothetical protein EOM73_08900 [Bacteroidia bacterium]|nr:hypothetical protein [Bacteroidia bacterium]
MKTTENYLEEIKEIRKMMEQSSRFLSLSGLSGIIIGLYAVAGACIAYRTIYVAPLPWVHKIFGENVVYTLIFVAFLVLAFSLLTTLWLTWRKAAKAGQKIWNRGSQLMMTNLAIPFISGGILVLIFTLRGYYMVIAPACLVFYGLALINSAKFTRQEIFYLGLLQIALGIVAALFPQAALLFWALGFGMLHIIYGTVMYFRYEHPSK